MFGYSTVFRIDSHARTTTVCALVVETGETETRTFPGNPYADIAAWMGRFPQPSLGVYESVLHRLRARSAAGAIRPSAESRSKKNDRRDAARLARLAAAGGLREVWVPSEEVEGPFAASARAPTAWWPRSRRVTSARPVHPGSTPGRLCRGSPIWWSCLPAAGQ